MYRFAKSRHKVVYAMPSSLLKAAAVLCTAILLTGASANDLDLASLARTHPRDLPIKRATDCGTWVMTCKGAEDACQNACYYVNNVNKNFVATYSSKVDNDKERGQSGCQTQQGSVCNAAPFSQRFHDDQEPVTSGKAPGNANYNCDEFPMAGMEQQDFKSLPAGTVRNSLRCIRADENSCQWAPVS